MRARAQAGVQPRWRLHLEIQESDEPQIDRAERVILLFILHSILPAKPAAERLGAKGWLSATIGSSYD